ncbi:hypothetical protein FQV39_08565 [Bosea sp. F3-2]|nr:hypothetical protein FQV39_08565 [Bosea sp. F3-2]
MRDASRHCEERSDEAIQGPSRSTPPGLRRCARNDGKGSATPHPSALRAATFSRKGRREDAPPRRCVNTVAVAAAPPRPTPRLRRVMVRIALA